MADPTPVLIDTDVALDDWMAILFLLNTPSVKVIGITTTGVGAAHLTPGTRNVQNLLLAAGQPDIPVAAGTNAPLLYSNVYPGSFRQQVDSAYGLELPSNTQPLQSASAADFIVSTLTNSPTNVTVLSIGGGTNLALALQQEPEVAGKIDRIYLMGGALDVPGNVADFNPDYTNTVAEWNIFVDPKGAQLVFQSGIPITLIPLDATSKVPLDTRFYDALGIFVFATQPLTPPAAQIIFAGLATQLSTIQAGQYFFWDPLAAVLLADSSPITQTQDTPIEVQLALNEEADTSGQLTASGSGPAVTVVMDVDAGSVQSAFFSAITGGASLAEFEQQAAKRAASGA